MEETKRTSKRRVAGTGPTGGVAKRTTTAAKPRAKAGTKEPAASAAPRKKPAAASAAPGKKPAAAVAKKAPAAAAVAKKAPPAAAVAKKAPPAAKKAPAPAAKNVPAVAAVAKKAPAVAAVAKNVPAVAAVAKQEPAAAAVAKQEPTAGGKKEPAARRASLPAPPVPQDATSLRRASAKQTALAVALAALDRKAERVEIVDIGEKVDYADYLVVMTGRSDRQVVAIADGIEQALTRGNNRTVGVEGLPQGHWVLLDCGDVIAHVFLEEARKYYDLEGLWMDAPRVPTPSFSSPSSPPPDRS